MGLPLVRESDQRPARMDGTCFYCQVPIGSEHRYQCVLLQRKVKLRYSFEIEVEVPHAWDPHGIWFHRNEGSWCADNALDELKRLTEIPEGEECSPSGGCLCNIFKCEVMEFPTAEPYLREDGK